MLRFCSKYLNYIKTSYHIVYPPLSLELSTAKFVDALLCQIVEFKENQNRPKQQTTGTYHILFFVAQIDDPCQCWISITLQIDIPFRNMFS